MIVDSQKSTCVGSSREGTKWVHYGQLWGAGENVSLKIHEKKVKAYEEEHSGLGIKNKTK